MIFLPGCKCCQTSSGIYVNRCGFGCNYTWEVDGLSQSMARCSNEVPEAYQGEGFQRIGCDDTLFQRANPYWTSGTVLQSAVGYQGITSTTNYPAYGAVNYTFGFDDGQTLGRYQNSVSKYWIRQGYSINPDDDPDGWIYKQYDYTFRVTPFCIDFLAYDDEELCEIQCPDGPVSVYRVKLGFRVFLAIAARITTATGAGSGSYDKSFSHLFLIPKPQTCADITDFERVQNGVPCCGFTEEGCVDPLPGQGPGSSGCVEVREYYFDSPTFLRLSESGVQVETDSVYDYDWEVVTDLSYGVAPALPAELTEPHEIRLDWTSSTCCCYDDEGNSLTCNPLP